MFGDNCALIGFGLSISDAIVVLTQVGVHMPADPVLAAWTGASAFAISPEYSQQAVTRAQYEELGCDRLLNIAPQPAKSAEIGYYTSSG